MGKDIDECIETIKNSSDKYDVESSASDILTAIFEGECRRDALAEVLQRKDEVHNLGRRHYDNFNDSFIKWVWKIWGGSDHRKAAVTSASQELADIMTKEFDGYSRAMGDFRRLFPDNASKIFDKALSQGLVMKEDFIEAFADKITPENLEQVNPYNLKGLLALIKTVPGKSVSSQWLVNVFRKAAANGFYYENEEVTSSIMETLDGELRGALVGVLQEKATDLRMDKSFVAQLFLKTPGVSGKVLDDSIRYLAGLKSVYRIKIATPYHIPDTLTGKKLCKTIALFDKALETPKGMITGLPSEEDFKTKTLDCLLTDKPLYDTALIALKSLLVKVVAGANYLDQLKSMVSNLRGTVEGGLEDEVFLRAKEKGCWDMFMDLMRCIIKTKGTGSIAYITHEKARLMIEALDKLFPDVDWQKSQSHRWDEGAENEENEGLAGTAA